MPTDARESRGTVTARRGSRVPKRASLFGLLGAVVLAGAACTPVLAPPPPPPPPPPPNQCASSVNTTDLAPATSTPAALSVSQAATSASQATAASPANVTLVTAERGDDGTLDIESHPTTKAQAPAVAAAAASDGDLVAVDVPHPVTTATVSNDQGRAQQWALTDVPFESVWPRFNGAGVTVAVVDSGVQANHPDLVGRVLSGAEFLHNTGVSSCNGQNDGLGHGTHVAGIIAANANNGIGIAGAAPVARILPVRVLDSTGSGFDTDVARGIDYATANGAKVVNLSLGGTSSSSILQAAITNAVAHGVTVVAAGGNIHTNTGVDPASYPGAFPNVVAVAAVSSNNVVATFGTQDAYIDVAAPGVDVFSTYKGSAYATMSGTSMATPYVAAAAALLVQQHPSWTPAHVQSCLESSATHLGAGGKNPATGSGLINPAAAVSCT